MTWRHIPLLFGAMLITYILHESAHWAMGEILGYDMWLRINSVGLAQGEYSTQWHQYLVSAAGPLATVIQGVIAFLVIRRRKAVTAFAFLFSAFIMRFTAMLVSINNPNDEARVSEWLGLGPWTLHILVVVSLLALTVKGGSYLKLGWKSYLLAYVIVSIATTVVIFSESALPVLNLYQ